MAAPASLHVLSRRFIPALRAFCCGALLITGLATSAFAAKWAPVPPEDLADAKPRIDPEAGAEILLRKITITHDEVDQFTREYFVRAKIYSERGLEDFVKIELPYDNDTEVRNINVRTLKPDGQIIELTKKDIYDREVVKVGKERVKVKSFSPAGVQPGAIVEYSYTEIDDGWSWYVAMHFQSSLPTRSVTFRFRPIDTSTLAVSDSARLNARTIAFNCPEQPMKPDSEGYYTFSMKDVPALKNEEFQPPALNSRSALLFCYSLEKQLPPKAFWEKQGKDLHERMLKVTKPTKLVRTTLDGLLSPGDSEEQKLTKIYDFCRTKLVNRHSLAASFTREQRKKFTLNETASDTLKAGSGSGEDINAVFVALARAAGFDARFAAANDRSFLLFNPALTEPFMANDLLGAVQVGANWQYFDPGVIYLPFATPYWRNTGTAVLLAAPKDAAPVLIDASAPDVSQEKRKATLTLDADGTLEGDVIFEYSGHQAVSKKFDLDYKTPAERETYIREEIQASLKLAEVTAVKVENATDPLAPLTIAFHLRVPEYADRTGSRLFFQPAVFQKNVPLLFPEATRRTDLMFRYRSMDTDEIRIVPPEGYELEEASAPGSLDLGNLGAYETSVAITKKTGAVIYRRKFVIKSIGIPKTYYDVVRDAFEIVHKRDAHTLTLRRKAAPAETPASPPATEPAPPPPPAAKTPSPEGAAPSAP